jgi:5-methyltetrahydrofolate--homocysteine methyltransferase
VTHRVPDRTAELVELARERILVLDGAMGTALQDAQLSAEDFGGEDLDGCNENLVFTRPDVVRDVHRRYLDAGADIIETNSFGGTPLVLAEYGLADRAEEINRVAATLARAEADAARQRDGRPRFVAGSMGPTTKSITVTGGVSFAELIEHFRVQAAGLIAGGADLLLVETQQDTRNAKAAAIGIERAAAQAGVRLPLMLSGTIEPTGTMLAGQAADAFVASMAHLDLFSIGLNCATGPEFMTDSIRSMAPLARTRMSCIPNAGLPDEDGQYREGPQQIASVLERFADAGWLNLVGGCCGTTPDHIRALADMARGKAPRQWEDHHRSLYTGIDLVEVEADNRPLLVGERTNVIGSRKFKRLIREEKFEEASEIARAQARGGAQVLDVCLADPDRDELTDMDAFLDQVIRRIKMPLMIDSTDAAVVERALTWSQGKAIINSVNLEDGEARFEEITPLVHRFGAALVVGCIDEDPDQGMAVTRERKLEIARRSHALLTGKYGLREEDLIFDPLVFPCATGDENYVGSARETIEGLRAIKAEFPRARTILGISNVSFGLPPAGREVLNSVFLYHCTRAGLDLAIVNTEKLERFASIPREEVQLADDLLFDRGDDPVAAFAAHFREATGRTGPAREELPLDERIARCVVEGSKEGLIEDLDAKLADTAPLDIINGPLMAGMDEVGRLFNDNQLIVAEVLQSAEVMKAAVGHLEPRMPRGTSAGKGKVLLATVKGDVHDIGKNLVEIILSNNGYEVINLGIKVPPAVLIEAVAEHAPDFIGLSGLLVKSAQQMVVTAEDLRENRVTVPMLVGGAALSGRFTHNRIAPAYAAPTLYARDAMDGLALVERIRKEGTDALVAEQRERHAVPDDASPREAVVREVRREAIDRGLAIPEPEDPGPGELDVPLDEAFALINPQMLFGKHMGYRGRFERGMREGDPVLLRLVEQMDAVKRECRDGAMRARARWAFVPAERDGDAIVFFDRRTGGSEIGRLEFPRQSGEHGACLADYVLDPGASGRDHVGLFVTTAGEGILDLSATAREDGQYVRSHALQALAVETAEGAAEWIHRRMRAAWGFPDEGQLDPKQIFKAQYRGKRYSFGYPACPDLDGQRLLFDLLRPERIGVGLTEGMMMEPEASVSALVFHHPQARYFAVD